MSLKNEPTCNSCSGWKFSPSWFVALKAYMLAGGYILDASITTTMTIAHQRYIFCYFEIQHDVYTCADWLGTLTANQLMLSGGFNCKWDLNWSTYLFGLLPPTCSPHLQLSLYIPAPATSNSKQFNLTCTSNTKYNLSSLAFKMGVSTPMVVPKWVSWVQARF